MSIEQAIELLQQNTVDNSYFDSATKEMVWDQNFPAAFLQEIYSLDPQRREKATREIANKCNSGIFPVAIVFGTRSDVLRIMEDSVV